MLIPLQDGLANATTDQLLEDIIVRFIMNAPDEAFSDTSRFLFLIEEAQWFYQDYIINDYPNAQPLGFKSFVKKVCEILPFVWIFKATPDEALKHFSQYKQKIPVRGAALFNKSCDRILLVQGMESVSWSFPRGKISKDENDVDCAIREVKEEINYDITEHISENEYVERTIRGKNFKIYLCKNLPDDYPYRPIARGEIKEIKWENFKKVCNQLKYMTGKEKDDKYFLLPAVLKPLQDWVKRNRGEFNEAKLKKRVEIQLKHILGIETSQAPSARPVIDAGREILELLKKSSQTQKEEKDAEFLNLLANKSSSFNGSSGNALQPPQAPNQLQQPLGQHHPQQFIPPSPFPMHLPPVAAFGGGILPPNIQQWLPPQHHQFVNFAHPQTLIPPQFAGNIQRFQQFNLPPQQHPFHFQMPQQFTPQQNSNFPFPPAFKELNKSISQREGKTSELLSLLHKPSEPKKETISTSESSKSGNQYSAGLLALLSKKDGSAKKENVGSSTNEPESKPSEEHATEPSVRLGSPIHEMPKPKLRMLKRGEDEQSDSSSHLQELLRPMQAPSSNSTSDNCEELDKLEKDLDRLQQTVDEAYENDKSIHQSYEQKPIASKKAPVSSSKKIKILKRGEALPSSKDSTNTDVSDISFNAAQPDESKFDQMQAPLINNKYKEFDHDSVVSTIEFTDDDDISSSGTRNDQSQSGYESGFAQRQMKFSQDLDDHDEDDEDDEDEEEHDNDEEELEEDEYAVEGQDEDDEEYEGFESYDEDEEALLESERLKQFYNANQEEEEQENPVFAHEAESSGSSDADADDDDDVEFHDSSDNLPGVQGNVPEPDHKKNDEIATHLEKSEDSPVTEEDYHNAHEQQPKQKLQLLGAKKLAPGSDLLSLLHGKFKEEGAAPAKKEATPSLEEIESAYIASVTPSANKVALATPQINVNSIQAPGNEILSLLNKPQNQNGSSDFPGMSHQKPNDNNNELESGDTTRYNTPINDPSSSLLNLLHKKVQVPGAQSPQPQQQPVFLEDIEQPNNDSLSYKLGSKNRTPSDAGAGLMGLLKKSPESLTGSVKSPNQPAQNSLLSILQSGSSTGTINNNNLQKHAPQTFSPQPFQATPAQTNVFQPPPHQVPQGYPGFSPQVAQPQLQRFQQPGPNGFPPQPFQQQLYHQQQQQSQQFGNFQQSAQNMQQFQQFNHHQAPPLAQPQFQQFNSLPPQPFQGQGQQQFPQQQQLNPVQANNEDGPKGGNSLLDVLFKKN